jgi:predicted phosphodiesterase
MRILVISDIHANLTALDTVLSSAGDVDAVWCLGDVVGYGPDPNECVQRVQSLPNLICIMGNHDAAALNLIDTESFNYEARVAIHWTRQQLTAEGVNFLNQLPQKYVFETVTLTHGSPRHPVWEYILDTNIASINFDYFDTDYCFVGHSHLPAIYNLLPGNHLVNLIFPEPNTKRTLVPRAIVNPGSVGQPRDRDPRAAYAIFDLEGKKWEYYRVAYDIHAVQKRMRNAGLPQRHIQRLAAGW